jgi:hypothetical protein
MSFKFPLKITSYPDDVVIHLAEGKKFLMVGDNIILQATHPDTDHVNAMTMAPDDPDD